MMTDEEYSVFVSDFVRDYKGDGALLASALGAFTLGRQVGWRVLALLHSETTIRKYQKVLNVNFKDVLDERGKYSDKSLALKVVDKFDNFWAVVQGRAGFKMPKEEKLMLQ